MYQPSEHPARRTFLRRLGLLGATSCLGLPVHPIAAAPQLETTKLRIGRGPSLCQAPQLVVEEVAAVYPDLVTRTAVPVLGEAW